MEVIPPERKPYQEKSPADYTKTEFLMQKGREMAWKEWSKTYSRYGLMKFLANAATGIIVLGSWMAALNGYPQALCVDPLVIAGDVLLQKKLENASDKAWHEKWLDVYQSDRGGDVSNEVIDYDEKKGRSIIKK